MPFNHLLEDMRDLDADLSGYQMLDPITVMGQGRPQAQPQAHALPQAVARRGMSQEDIYEHQLGLALMGSGVGGLQQAGGQVFKQALGRRAEQAAAEEAARKQAWAEQKHREVLDARREDQNLRRQDVAEQREWQRAMQAQTRQGQIDQRTAADVERFSKRYSDMAAVDQALINANQVLAPYLERGGNIPGIGPWQGRMPNMLTGDEGQIVRGAIASVVNPLLRARSGAAVTENELNRFLMEMGMGPGASEESFRQGWQRIQQVIDAERQAIRGGHSPEALDLFQQRTGAAPLDVPGAAPRGGQPVQVRSIEEAMALPPGTRFIDPNGQPRTR